MATESYYDPLSHRYYYGDVEWPGVTRILIETGHIDTMWYREGAAERGRKVHKLCEDYDRRRGQFTEPVDADRFLATCDPDLANELLAYMNFVAEYKPVYDGIEQPSFTDPSDAHPFGGCPDRSCAFLVRGPATLEIKTGAEADWHGVQLAGYQRLKPRGARYVVYLGRSGNFKFRPATNPDDHREFEQARKDIWAQLRQR